MYKCTLTIPLTTTFEIEKECRGFSTATMSIKETGILYSCCFFGGSSADVYRFGTKTIADRPEALALFDKSFANAIREYLKSNTAPEIEGAKTLRFFDCRENTDSSIAL